MAVDFTFSYFHKFDPHQVGAKLGPYPKCVEQVDEDENITFCGVKCADGYHAELPYWNPIRKQSDECIIKARGMKKRGAFQTQVTCALAMSEQIVEARYGGDDVTVDKEVSDGKAEVGTIRFFDGGANSFLEIFGRTTIGDGCDKGAFAITCVARNPSTNEVDASNPWNGFRSDLNSWKVKSGLTSAISRYDLHSMETPCNSKSNEIQAFGATTSYKNLWSVEADSETIVVFKGSPYVMFEFF